MRAAAAPFAAACWLSLLALPVPLLPRHGVTLGIALAGPYALILFILAVVLFIRGQVARGLITLLLGAALAFWLHGGTLLTFILLHQRGIEVPWLPFGA